MAAIEIDESRYPLLIVRFEGVSTDDEFKHYLSEMARLRRRGPGAAILDASESGPTPAHHRKMQAEWLKENRDMLERCSLGTAFVINSAIVRGILTAILWVSPVPGPYTVAADFEDAEKWAVGLLRNAGIRVPPAAFGSARTR